MNVKTVLITGASRGIGRSIALKFAAQGYHIFLNCRSSVEQLTAVKDEITAISQAGCRMLTGDVGNPDDVKEIFHRMHEDTDTLDVLVNNAGCAYVGLLSDMSDDQWSEVIRINLSSAFYCCREAVKAMVRQKYGRIINISSMWGVSGASCEAAYSAAKSGVHGLTQALAKELAPSNIQVNAIACGVIDTAMNSQLSMEERSLLCSDIPAGRFGTPEEAASLAWQLANSPEYLTGQVIAMDGGYL